MKVSKGEEADNERVAKNREELEEKGLGVIVNMEDFEVGSEILARCKIGGSNVPLDMGREGGLTSCLGLLLWSRG